MTDIERYQPPAQAVDSWVPVMGDVIKLSNHIAETEFVPKGLRNKPAAVAAAILAGRETGIGPMTSLQHMHVVDGRPTMSAELKRARVLAAGHDIVYEEMTTTRCRVKGRRRGSEQWTTVEWTLDDAKAGHLLGKDNWRKWPRRMLQARATGELCDVIFPDVVGGLATYEEVVDDAGDYVEATDGAAEPKPARRTARRRTAPKKPPPPEPEQTPAKDTTSAVPEPPLPGEEGYDDQPESRPAASDVADNPAETATEWFDRNPGAAQAEAAIDEENAKPITQAQMKKMHALFGRVEWTDRDDRLRAASVIVGRQLDSSNDLSKEEANGLIDTLELVAQSPDPQMRLTELIERTKAAEVRDAEIVEEGKP